MTTTNTRQLSKILRQEMYDLIWSTPATKLASDFGVSDVAVAKRCKRLNVPRPSRGYWAKIAAGEKPQKRPLPPPGDEVFAKAAARSAGKALSLPDQTTPLHPLAAELVTAIAKARLDSDRLASLHDAQTLPDVTVSKKLAERVAKAFHVILNGVGPLGILFSKSRSWRDSGYFKRGHDRLYLKIEEDLVDSLGERRQTPSWAYPRPRYYPTGLLSFSLQAEKYGQRDSKQWSETAKVPLEKILAQVVTAIRQHYLDIQNRRIQEAIEWEKKRAELEREWREEEAREAIRLQREREQKHASALEAVARARKEDLVKAAERWRMSCGLVEFVNECERRWKQTSAEVTAEQQAWLKWAREYADGLSPFVTDYPNPVNDGAFDPAAVPFGGPYPLTRNFL